MYAFIFVLVFFLQDGPISIANTGFSRGSVHSIAKSIIYEEFKCKNRYIHFYQFEIFAIKAAEKQRK